MEAFQSLPHGGLYTYIYSITTAISSYLVELMYLKTAFPSVKLICEAGRT